MSEYNITFVDPKFCFRTNFEGRGERYNRVGDRNFDIIPDADGSSIYKQIAGDEHLMTVDNLIKDGLNIRTFNRPEIGEVFKFLKIRIKYGEGSDPIIRIGSNGDEDDLVELSEDEIDILDKLFRAGAIMCRKLKTNTYHWTLHHSSGIALYLTEGNFLVDLNALKDNHYLLAKVSMLLQKGESK